MRCLEADMSRELGDGSNDLPVSPFLLRSVGVDGPPRLPFGLKVSHGI